MTLPQHEQRSMDAQGIQILTAGTLYTPEEIPGPVSVVVDSSRIRALWRDTDAEAARRRVQDEPLGPSPQFVDLGHLRLAPGYIDIHDHGLIGFHGHDVATGSLQDITAMADELPRTGTTAFLPTIATTGPEETARQVRYCVEAMQRQTDTAAEVLGIRLEGPYISIAKKGAQYAPAIRKPNPAELRALMSSSEGSIRIVDFAPEEDANAALLATLVELGILASIGHTNGTYEQAIRALDNGARHCTHLFNAMSAIGHRAPGVPGAMLTDQRPTVEIIADGVHLAPAILKLVVAARGPDYVALITDAVGPVGLPEGTYEFINRKIIVSGGAVRLEDGTIAGSALTMERAVQNMVALAGCTWPMAIRMATLTPARILGMSDRKGQIIPGADADLVALDGDGLVQQVWTRGRVAYRRDEQER